MSGRAALSSALISVLPSSRLVKAALIDILQDARVVNRVKSSRVERGAMARARLSSLSYERPFAFREVLIVEDRAHDE
jgi:hypothetical protein